MSYCYDFIRKFKKEGNFCGLDKSEVSRLEAYIEIIDALMKQHIEEKTIVDNFPLGAARHLIPIKDERRADGLTYVTQQLKAGKHISGKDIQQKLEISNNKPKTKPESEKDPKSEKKQDPDKCFSPQPGTIEVSGKVQPSLAEQMKEPEDRTSPPVPEKKPLPASWITDPPKDPEAIKQAARLELEAAAERLLDLMPRSTQLAVTDQLREHPSWKVKDCFYYGIEALAEKRVKK